MRLRIFSEKSLALPGQMYEPILYPFFGTPFMDPKRARNGCYPWVDVFDNYISTAASLFEFSRLKDADLTILPVNWAEVSEQQTNSLVQALQEYQGAGAISVSFFGGDFSHKNLQSHCDLVFRQSLFSSRRKSSDFAMPVWGEDFICLHFGGNIEIRRKSSRPVVGFCGFSIRNGIKTQAKNVFRKLEKAFLSGKVPINSLGHLLRFQALEVLSDSSLLNTNFRVSDKPFFSKNDADSQLRQRLSYIRNLVESDYVLCCRGYGNFSFRFYEALSFGRIPVLINTDCVLPYDFEIDWKKYCVWVEEDEIPWIDRKIMDFHEGLNESEFISLQYECRELWQSWLSPEGFFANLYRHIPLVTSGNRQRVSNC